MVVEIGSYTTELRTYISRGSKFWLNKNQKGTKSNIGRTCRKYSFHFYNGKSFMHRVNLKSLVRKIRLLPRYSYSIIRFIDILFVFRIFMLQMIQKLIIDIRLSCVIVFNTLVNEVKRYYYSIDYAVVKHDGIVAVSN